MSIPLALMSQAHRIGRASDQRLRAKKSGLVEQIEDRLLSFAIKGRSVEQCALN